MIDNTVQGPLDVNKYLGEWYEIARFNHRFERGITHSKVKYDLLPGDKIAVVNTGIKNGIVSIARGKAKFTDEPRHLRVTFFWPFYGDYRILLLDDDYRWALIGSGSEKYLWILSRTPQLPAPVLDRILAESRCRGYNTEDLIWVEQ